jgi:hypothetical protein
MHTLSQLLSGQLLGTKKLSLSCELTEFPPEIFDLADTLEILDLSRNQLTQLPEDFDRLQKLKIVFLSENLFTEFPRVLAKCPHLTMIGFKANRIFYLPENGFPPLLRWLILTDNRISFLPPTIGNCHHLQKVMLAGNNLSQLPKEMASCRRIELLRISANQFYELPTWLLSLPRLSWLAFSGNPCSGPIQLQQDLLEIHWDSLQLEELLGEGASGQITRARWAEKASQEVAVKVFKGQVTSDGFPLDEMNTCLAAGAHPHLVPVIGKLIHHPQKKQGLVLDLIPSNFKNLGGPPNFDTCTRDNFPEGTLFSTDQLVRIASGIASACAHLHARGLSHGDLYAHNILIDEEAHALLGDFGAATAYDRTDPNAEAIERLEVRAYGCLLEDLLNHLKFSEKEQALVSAFIRLKEECMKVEVLLRPDFEAICTFLKELPKP